jgi:hypothetical protein
MRKKFMWNLEVYNGKSHVGFMIPNAALWQVFFEYYGFPCHSCISSSSISQGRYNRPESGLIFGGIGSAPAKNQ